jgi:DNA-binding response OmpR family regulator
VATATSRAEALEFFAPGATPPDMVLLDTSLHDTSGVKLLAELRQAYTPLQLPIIIITSRPSEASIVQALEAGANDVS